MRFPMEKRLFHAYGYFVTNAIQQEKLLSARDASAFVVISWKAMKSPTLPCRRGVVFDYFLFCQ